MQSIRLQVLPLPAYWLRKVSHLYKAYSRKASRSGQPYVFPLQQMQKELTRHGWMTYGSPHEIPYSGEIHVCLLSVHPNRYFYLLSDNENFCICHIYILSDSGMIALCRTFHTHKSQNHFQTDHPPTPAYLSYPRYSWCILSFCQMRLCTICSLYNYPVLPLLMSFRLGQVTHLSGYMSYSHLPVYLRWRKYPGALNRHHTLSGHRYDRSPLLSHKPLW